MSTRIKTLALLTASAALSAAASAQTSAVFQTALVRMAPLGFGNSTPTLFSRLDMPVAPSMLVATDVTLQPVNGDDATTADLNTWTVVTDRASDDEKRDAGFLGSTMGRASMVGLAGLAGVSYLALRSDGSAIEQPTVDAVTSTLAAPVAANLPAAVAPSIVVTPEPASVALMALGLGGIALLARRRADS